MSKNQPFQVGQKVREKGYKRVGVIAKIEGKWITVHYSMGIDEIRNADVTTKEDKLEAVYD